LVSVTHAGEQHLSHLAQKRHPSDRVVVGGQPVDYRFGSYLRRAGDADDVVHHVDLQRAVEWGRIPTNPVRLIRKPTAKRERAVRPLAPLSVEAMRARLLGQQRMKDATLVCVLAYAGLRPSEALALRWRDIQTRTLLVERALTAEGAVKRTKTGQVRSVRLIAPLREDLLAWRREAGDAVLVFPNSRGAAWNEDDGRNWRHRVFAPTAEAVGLTRVRPYDLRHSAASLWLHEGRTIIEVATWMGHSGQMALSTYLHVMSDLGDERISAEDAIRHARAALVPSSYPSAASHSDDGATEQGRFGSTP
jgi:integrase